MPPRDPPAVVTPDWDARRAHFGYVLTEDQLAPRVAIRSIFLGIPQVWIVGQTSPFELRLAAPLGGFCEPALFIDGRKAPQDELLDFRPQQIAAVQVYPRLHTAPLRYQDKHTHSGDDSCGVILVWTKTRL